MPPSARPSPTPGMAGPSSPACPARRSPPLSMATWTPPPMNSRSPDGSAAASPGTWPSLPVRPAPTSWTSTSTAPPETATPPSPRSSAPGWSTARQPTCGPGPRDARLLHRLPSAQRPLAQPPSGLPLPRWLHPRPALQVDGNPYRLIKKPAATAAWTGPQSPPSSNPSGTSNPRPRPDPDRALSQLARWVASQPEGNRNAGVYWAANRALDADPAADLSPLAAAARQAGLGRSGDHPDPRLRPQDKPGPQPPGRGGELR